MTALAVPADDGARHVAIVHGDPSTPLERWHVDAFVAALQALVATAPRARVRCRRDRVGVSVAGAHAGERVARIAALAAAADPGGWRVIGALGKPAAPGGPGRPATG